MPNITTVPRSIVKTTLDGLRLPVTVLARLTHNEDTAAWPPAIAADTFESQVKQVVGSLLRDDDLVQEGKLQRAKVAKLTTAARLEAEAEQTRAVAAERFKTREQLADEARDRAEREADERERRIAREKDEKERRSREAAAKREQAAAKAEQVIDKAAAANEREVERARIKEESEALTARSEALAATRRAQRLDDAVEAKRADRKA